jgi:hypothetical protein
MAAWNNSGPDQRSVVEHGSGLVNSSRIRSQMWAGGSSFATLSTSARRMSTSN